MVLKLINKKRRREEKGSELPAQNSSFNSLCRCTCQSNLSSHTYHLELIKKIEHTVPIINVPYTVKGLNPTLGML